MKPSFDAQTGIKRTPCQSRLRPATYTLIREAFAGFHELLGELHEESYIYVQDVRAAAYGYYGKTQEHRFQHLI